ncbi:MAG: NADH:ubiquinone reductase (Na(+)-transporting) subunit A, partial [Bacteroidales bacterium]|nr:NADH:ubiquinone reductase (Na(+)-transporting) subunit A [Bacteroidales bacterium]
MRLKRGLNLRLAGAALPKVEKTIVSDTVAIVPDNFHGIVPKVVVKPGDAVKVGSVVMYDKNHPEVQFVSPVSGEVVAVERGERRKVLKIVIKNDRKDEAVAFEKASSAEEVKQLFLNAGMWGFIKQRPYDVIADPTVEPRDVFITAFDNAPLAPAFAYEMLA